MYAWNEAGPTEHLSDDLDLRWHVAAGLAGFGVGSFVALWFANLDLIGATTWLLVGSCLLSVWYKRLTSYLGVCLALIGWSLLVPGLFAPSAPYECGFCVSAGQVRGYLVFAGFLLAGIVHACGVPLRGRAGPSERRISSTALGWLGGALGVIPAAVLVFTMVFVPPAGSSFSVALPSGWERVRTSHAPEYCQSYAAVRGSASLVSARLSEVPPAPALCVAVVSFARDTGDGSGSDSGAKWCYHAFDHDGPHPNPLNDWKVQATSDASPMAGAHEEIRVSEQGDRIYGFGLKSSRSVGLITYEQVCFVVVVTVPSAATMSEVDVNAVVSAIRFP
jgi:hypothetical protein